jgi:hypothetical protein
VSKANLLFQVDSRLATLLGQEYTSSEKALKELVDNAWNADAEQVSVTLPTPMSDEPIVISDFFHRLLPDRRAVWRGLRSALADRTRAFRHDWLSG